MCWSRRCYHGHFTLHPSELVKVIELIFVSTFLVKRSFFFFFDHKSQENFYLFSRIFTSCFNFYEKLHFGNFLLSPPFAAFLVCLLPPPLQGALLFVHRSNRITALGPGSLCCNITVLKEVEKQNYFKPLDKTRFCF